MRVMQLTVLAYFVGFVTDVFDDGASASMDGPRPGRAVAADDLDAAVRTPPAPRPVDRDTEGSFIDADTDLEAERAADRAEVQKFLPRQCVHSVTDHRPKLTRGEQERTSKVIAHVAKRLKASDDFHKLLRMVAVRESSLQQGLVHRLSPDLEGSVAAWRKMQGTYEGNPHAKDQSKWQTYGLFGMNSNYFTLVWDKAASPEVLCDAIVDVLVYRRAAARMIRKAGGNIVCKDERGQPYDFTTKATWETVHRAVSGGKLCPSKHEATAATMRKFFRHRATRVGLDPDQPVTLKMLGLEPEKSLAGEPWADQETMVMGLWSEFEAAEALAQRKQTELAEIAAEKAAARVAVKAERVAAKLATRTRTP
jgi:hypothetical protein